MSDSNGLFRLDGSLALITGASRGLGKAIALGLSRHGARLALVARGGDALRAAAKEATTEARAFEADLADVDAIQELFTRICAECGRPDILVNCAGVTHRAPALEHTRADWGRVMTLNLEAPFVLSQCFARELIAARQGGRILNICSLSSGSTRPTLTAYTVSKTGLLGLTRALAVEWMPHGIGVNAIGPGYFETELTEPVRNDPAFNAWVRQRAPAGRWGKPEELVGAAVFLCSKASGFVTGQILFVDGGWTAAL